MGTERQGWHPFERWQREKGSKEGDGVCLGKPISREQVLEFFELRAGIVLAVKSHQSLEMLDNRVQRRRLMIRRAAKFEAHAPLLAHVPFERERETRFANARLTADHDDVPLPCLRLLRLLPQETQFPIPAHEWRKPLGDGKVEATRGLTGLHDTVDRRRCRQSFQRLPPYPVTDNIASDQAMCGRTHHHRIGLSEGLEMSRDIDRLTQSHTLNPTSRANIIKDHESGVNADAGMERKRIAASSQSGKFCGIGEELVRCGEPRGRGGRPGMPAQKYIVDLTAEERETLMRIVRHGKTPARQVRRARILLKAEEGETDEESAEAVATSLATVERTRPRFVEEHLGALTERPRLGAPRRLTGKAQAQVSALAWSPAPQGRERWTLRLVADQAVELGLTESLSHETVRHLLKKTHLPRGHTSRGACRR